MPKMSIRQRGLRALRVLGAAATDSQAIREDGSDGKKGGGWVDDNLHSFLAVLLPLEHHGEFSGGFHIASAHSGGER